MKGSSSFLLSYPLARNIEDGLVHSASMIHRRFKCHSRTSDTMHRTIQFANMFMSFLQQASLMETCMEESAEIRASITVTKKPADLSAFQVE